MLISHRDEVEFEVDEHLAKLKANEALSAPIEDIIQLFKELNAFELGRFLLANKGFNGFWTAYAILHGVKKQDLPPLEQWILFKAPGIVATRQRFVIFQQLVQQRLQDNMHIASIPCGLMDDLLSLDYSTVKNVQLTGIDLDNESLSMAKDNAAKHDIDFANFIKRDAWDLNFNNAFDVITSNGLNIYEHDDERVILLYKELGQCLKPGGQLITSFITPPPPLDANSPWKEVSQEDAIKQQVIFSDIIQANWQAFRSEEKTRHQLESAGLVVEEVINDQFNMFPTIVATKR